MPFEYKVDQANKLVCSCGWGVISDRDLLDHQQGLIRDHRISKGYHLLCDLQEATAGEVTNHGLQHLADMSPFGKGSRRVIVVKGALEFGLARIYFAYAEANPDELRVQYNNMDEAKRWLGITDSICFDGQKNGS